MNKKPINPDELKKIIQTTQAIECYKPFTAEVIKTVQQLRYQHGLRPLTETFIQEDVEWGLHGKKVSNE
jgi:hypothetical protein